MEIKEIFIKIYISILIKKGCNYNVNESDAYY